MATLTERPKLDLEIQFTLTESEARALEALQGYGEDAFIRFFYENLGKHYLQPHEKGLRSLLASIREQLPPILDRMSKAREVFTGVAKAVRQ